METLGSYQILGQLGRGGCGVVYTALDPRIGRKVAIKTIDANAETAQGAALRERFRREARAAGILSHPHIVTIHELNDASDVLYIVMEFVDGQTLADRMSGPDRLSLEFIVSILAAAADALDFAHAHNIVHRDVKPANFLITAAGHLKIADFGIAKIADADISLTHTGMVIGTAQYMSPEQVTAKPATGRSDQFSLAVIAYEMLTGQKPFQGDSWASVLHQILSIEPPPVSLYRDNLGDGVTAVLRKALTKDPAGRYESCRAFVDELAREVLGTAAYAAISQSSTPGVTRTMMAPTSQTVPAAIPSSVRPSPSPSSPSPSWIRPVAVGVGAAVVLFGGWLVYHRQSNKPSSGAPAAVVAEAPSTQPAEPPTQPPVQKAPVTAPKADTRPPEVQGTKSIARTQASPGATSPETRTVPSSTVTRAPVSTPAISQPPPQSPPTPSVTSQPAQTTARVEPPPAQAAPPKVTPAVPSRPTEADAWSQVANTADIAALDQFRQNYPNGIHFAEAARRIEQIEWDKALRAGDGPSFRNYLAKYPSGAFSDRAKAELARIEKAAEVSTGRSQVAAALDRYRQAFETKDLDALKAIWPGLGRSELSAIQNFFGIASTIKFELQPLGEAEISSTGASLRCRRIVAASDSRGPLPVQNQIVDIHFAKSGSAMIIQSVDVAGR